MNRWNLFFDADGGAGSGGDAATVSVDTQVQTDVSTQPVTEGIQTQTQEPVYERPKYYAQMNPTKADSEEYKALYKYQKIDELADALIASQKENDSLRANASKSIVVPDGKDPEAVKEFARKLGIPDEAKDYRLKSFDTYHFDEQSMNILKQGFHDSMLTETQANQVGVTLMKLAKYSMEHFAKDAEARKNNAESNLIASYKDLSAEVDRKSQASKDMAAYNVFVEETGLKEMFEQTGIKYDTRFVKAIASYARKHSSQIQVQTQPAGKNGNGESGKANYGSQFKDMYGGK